MLRIIFAYQTKGIAAHTSIVAQIVKIVNIGGDIILALLTFEC